MDAVKAISCTLSDYADVDFNHDVVQVRITPFLGLRFRQHTASLDSEPGSIGQLGDGTKDTRPIFGRTLLRQRCFDLQERHGRGQQQVADAFHYGCPPDFDDLASRTEQSPQRLGSNSKLRCHRSPTVYGPG